MRIRINNDKSIEIGKNRFRFGNSISTQEFEEFKQELGEASENKEKVKIFMRYIRQDPYYGKGAHIIYIDYMGSVKHKGPLTTAKSENRSTESDLIRLADS